MDASGAPDFNFCSTTGPSINLGLCTTIRYHALVALPLWVLTSVFSPLWPLAVTSALISLAVCIAAGAQAELPKEKAKWWSRPLVSLLFFLQPLVRGWARFQSRLMSRPVALPSSQSRSSELLWHSPRSPNEVCYWADRPMDRLAFVRDLLRRLDLQAWPNKPDAGWSEFDVEIYDARWSKLQITTVAEAHPRGRSLLRCRLRRSWSLRAVLGFWLVTGIESTVLGVGRGGWPWLWLVLLSLPLFVWFLNCQAKRLQTKILALLDEAASDWYLTRIPGEARRQP